MLKPFQEHITRHQLCKTTDKILLAVSGGIDSMVMLELFHRSGYAIAVAHGNFQLRDQDSEGDEQFVKNVCHQLQIPFFTTRFDTKNYAAKHGISTQMAARDLRYVWFEQLRIENAYDVLATAHHLNDNVETVIFNLAHGRGMDGMTGIPVKHTEVIRPLLFASRSEIEHYASVSSIVWREDVSNQTDDYKRNKIRHHVIPSLKEINTNLEHTVQRSVTKHQGAAELLTLGIQTFELKYTSPLPGGIRIAKTALHSFQYPGAVLYEIIKKYQFSLEQCEAVIKGLDGLTGKRHFTPTHQLVLDRTDVLITPTLRQTEEVLIPEGDVSVVMGNQTLELQEGPVSIHKESFYASLDADKMKYPLVWRKWRDGDFFYPLGMDAKKKISDFLIDRKIPRNEKGEVTVLESGGEIMWVVGYQVSNRFRIISDTKRAVHIRVFP